MEDLNSGGKRPHKLMLTGRRTCALTGVNDVLSFDVNEILLETEQGMLMIRGGELHVSRLSLDKGEVDIDGRIDSFTYSETAGYGAKGESLLARLFKKQSGRWVRYEPGDRAGAYFFYTFCPYGTGHHLCL